MSTIELTYTVILAFKKKPNDTILVEMMISIFHIKRFDSELFIFKDIGWQKVNEDELQGLISKMIQSVASWL
ncbi:putative primase [Staphylococcus gallinarum]|uniref:Putative primase n=1 Tax=Staphylococcus gallinarum TaxID=1293 RepID=A0A380F9Q9_STAGA|nr:putative primase [Staphylococcus gallinarum]